MDVCGFRIAMVDNSIYRGLNVMKYTAIAAFAASIALATTAAHSTIVGSGQSSVVGTIAVPSSGVGDDGRVMQGANVLTPSQPGTHFYIETGKNPSPVIEFAVDVSAINAPGRRPACIAQGDWTEPEYADGLSLAEWPLVFIDGASYLPTNQQPTAAPTQTFRFRALDAVNGFQPYNNYMVTVICVVKMTGQN